MSVEVKTVRDAELRVKVVDQELPLMMIQSVFN